MPSKILSAGAAAFALTGALSFGMTGTAIADEPSCQGGGNGNGNGNDDYYPPGQHRRSHVEDGQRQRGQQETAHSGCDFESGEDVEYGVESTYQKLGVVKADARGVATATFTVPTNLADGTHYVVFTSLRTGKAVRSPFQVQGGTFTGVAGSTGALPSTGSTGLPMTGSAYIVPLALTGAGMVGVGGAIVVAARRRREDSPGAMA